MTVSVVACIQGILGTIPPCSIFSLLSNPEPRIFLPECIGMSKETLFFFFLILAGLWECQKRKKYYQLYLSTSLPPKNYLFVFCLSYPVSSLTERSRTVPLGNSTPSEHRKRAHFLNTRIFYCCQIPTNLVALNNINLLSHCSVGQKSNTGFTGLKSRYLQDHIPFWSL